MSNWISDRVNALKVQEAENAKLTPAKRLERFHESWPGYNDVHAWMTPCGDLIISLDHRTCSDDACCVRIPAASLVDSILFLNDDPENEARYDRINEGGDWE